MRIGLFGPRILGVRPYVSVPVGQPAGRRAGLPSGKNFVYVVRGDHNLTKIGVTTNPRARLAQLRTGSGFPIEFAFIGAVSGSARDIETRAHAALNDHRVNGEWFDVSPDDATGAVLIAAEDAGHEVQPMSLDQSDTAPPVEGAPDRSVATAMWVVTPVNMVIAAIMLHFIDPMVVAVVVPTGVFIQYWVLRFVKSIIG